MITTFRDTLRMLKRSQPTLVFSKMHASPCNLYTTSSASCCGLRALQICLMSFTECALRCRPSGTLGLPSLELPFWESTQRMVSTISRPVHAVFYKCGCYSAPGNSTSTSRSHLPQESRVLICLSDLVCFVSMLLCPECYSFSEDPVCLQASSTSMWMHGTQTRTTSSSALRVSCLSSSRSGTSASPATWPRPSSASSRSTRSMRSAGSASLFAL